MPPLYRMPIVYLAAVAIAIAFGVGALMDRRGTRKAAAEQQTAEEEPPKTVVEPPEPKPEPTDGILRTAEGLRRKVLVTSLGLVCKSEPKGGFDVGEALDYFAIRYLFGESDETNPPMLQVGPREGPPLGWVASRSVLEWDTRLMARPTAKPDRPPLVIYTEEPCARAAASGQVCAKHAGRCPTEGTDKPSKASADAAKRPLGLPILRSEAAPGPDGKDQTLFEVASLVRDRAPPSRPKTLPDDLRAAIKQIDIALCIDTTSSMQPSIDAARKVAETLVADAQDRYKDVTLRLALVEYRDHSAVFGYPYRVATTFTDPAGFRAALDKLTAAKHGDNSVDEAVLDGVTVALPADFNAMDDFPHINWPSGRAGDLASKLIVLIGDAPDHAHDLDRARALAARARRSGIAIAAVTIDRGDDLSRDERVRYRAQWDALADGSARPRDAAGKVADAVMIPLAEAAQLAPRLQGLIDDRIERARDLAALAAAEAEGRLKEYVNRRGLTLDKVAPVLDDLHAGEPRDVASPDPQLDGVRAPSVRRGWIAEKVNGVPLVSLEVLMSKAELDALINELLQLQQAAQGTARDLADLLRIGTAAAAGETAFLAADRGSLTFADYLRRRQGLPPARPDSLLRRTQSDLLQADDLYRSALDARLRSSIAGLVLLRDSWTDPLLTADGLAPVPYDLIDF
ncbi:MAG TPA: vWA domain-containing protein [Isosphaeraceae bacterium]|jgi:hypothetical protein|nr:vWA domain-containing protein [Isosphaeraceae bacterium]